MKKAFFIIFNIVLTLPVICLSIYKLFYINNPINIFFIYFIILFISICFLIILFFYKILFKIKNNIQLGYDLYIYFILIYILNIFYFYYFKI